MKTMKFALLALMAGVMTLSGISGAEAGVKLEDLKILLNFKDDSRPPEPPAPTVREVYGHHGQHWAPRPGGPHPRFGRGPDRHDPKRVHAPQYRPGPKGPDPRRHIPPHQPAKAPRPGARR